MARVYGLEVLRMADADVLPYDYEDYGKEISVYLAAAKNKARDKFGDKAPDFGPQSRAHATCSRPEPRRYRSSVKCLLKPAESMLNYAKQNGRC